MAIGTDGAFSDSWAFNRISVGLWICGFDFYRGVFSGRVAPDTIPACHCDAGGDLRQFSFCLLQKSAATNAAGVEFPSGERQPECQGGRARVAGLADVPHYLFKGNGYAMTPTRFTCRKLIPTRGMDWLLNGPLSVLIPFGIWGAAVFL